MAESARGDGQRLALYPGGYTARNRRRHRRMAPRTIELAATGNAGVRQTMSNYTCLNFEVREQVAHITLNRPEAANALNLPLAQELEEVSLRCNEGSDVRAVLLTGAGKLFCAGG